METIRINPYDEELRKKLLKLIYNGDTPPLEYLSVVDLDIYSEPDTFFKKLTHAVRISNVDESIILTNEQFICLGELATNDLFISAPTSFGKTYISFEYISRYYESLNTIVYIVPTISLMNELRRKIYKYFKNDFVLITSEAELSYNKENGKKIFILVPERANTTSIKSYLTSNRVDFLVYDEIYKLHSEPNYNHDNERIIIMNYIYKLLLENANKVLLLGPFIKDVKFSRSSRNFSKYITNLNLVYNEVNVMEEGMNYFGGDKDKRFIYFKSPRNIQNFINSQTNNLYEISYDEEIVQWLIDNVHEDWYYVKYLKSGIGIHHGNTPIYLRKYIEDEYLNGNIHTILCTSTLIEGINTPTKSLIVYDKPHSPFDLNNLIGRVGRLNPSSPQRGEIYFRDEEIEKMYNPDDWLELKILYEDQNILTNSYEDEGIYLEKELSEDIQRNVEEFEHLLIEKYSINYNMVRDKGLEYKILENFIESVEDISSATNEYKVYSILRSIIMAEYTIATKGQQLINYSFYENSKEDEEKYLKFRYDVVYSMLIGVEIKEIVRLFEKTYSSELSNKRVSVSDINIFINSLFEIDSFIKFHLSKFITVYELFKESGNDDISSNEYLYQIVQRLRKYSDTKDGYERILGDMGFPDQDITILRNHILSQEDIQGTENKLSNIKNKTVELGLSPFGKRILKDF